AVASLLSDPSAYASAKGQPDSALVDFVHELVLTNRYLQAQLRDPDAPVSRALIDGKWCVVWRDTRSSSTSTASFEYDVCISFAGSDRAVAEEIATRLSTNGMGRKVFYDDSEKVSLWGEELFQYLYEVYSQRCKFCLILFSHAYRQRAWTRHELRAAQ